MSIDSVHEDFPRLETKRLVLGEIMPGDAEAILRILGDEEASMGVLQKLGFQEEGILRERIYVNNQFYDVKMYSLLRREYIKGK